MEIWKYLIILSATILLIVIGSKVIYSDNIAVISGQMILEANSQSNLNSNIEQQTILNIDFPKGFNKDNCFCLTFGIKTNEDKNYSYGVGDSISNRSFTGSLIRNVILGAPDDNSKIALHVWQPSTSQKTAYYRLVLMKIPAYVEGVDYKLGDVDQNGKIEEADADLVLNYSVGKAGLTEQQLKAADINKDRKINSYDALMIKKYATGQISSFN